MNRTIANFAMKESRLLSTIALFQILVTANAFSQPTYQVGTGPGELTLDQAIIAANQSSGGLISVDASDFTNQTITLNSQMLVIESELTINGNGITIDMQNTDRAFSVFESYLQLNNLTIANGSARGGNGGNSGGGGGAGLGGAIFVSSAELLDNGFSFFPNLTLNNVSFVNNAAQGGAGAGDTSSTSGGGGGGMGGNGGSGYYQFLGTHGGGGGGGFGNGADGGASDPNSPGNRQRGSASWSLGTDS